MQNSVFISDLYCILRPYSLFFADELLGEKEKYKGISEELDTTFAELAGF